MESTESPLEVLSRAATMVQDLSPPDYECSRKVLPGRAWRRERRDRGKVAPVDAPLDMTTPRGLPPPYSACPSSRRARPSVITCLSSPAPRLPRREQLSDPVIDEHFRRSLGSDYNSLFRDEVKQGGEQRGEEAAVTVTGLSVDDHFAKALGDTWTKLQQSDAAPAAPADQPPLRGLVTI